MEKITVNNKEFPIRLHVGKKPQYVFVTHHGILSNASSWKYFEQWVAERGIVLSYDARLNGTNTLKASRFAVTYVNDLRDVILYAKKRWPHLKVVAVGSSWGACIVSWLVKKYPNLVHKAVGWSMPMRVVAKPRNLNQNLPTTSKTLERRKIAKELPRARNAPHETGTFGYLWRFMATILLNINTKSYTKIDVQTITENRAIIKLTKLSPNLSIKPTPVKLFYSALKMVIVGPANMKVINKKSENKYLYVQSINDEYIKERKLDKIRRNAGRGVVYIELSEGKHAFQWEKVNNLHIRVFDALWNFIEGDLNVKVAPSD